MRIGSVRAGAYAFADADCSSALATSARTRSAGVSSSGSRRNCSVRPRRSHEHRRALEVAVLDESEWARRQGL
jgi:hypothetical protein